ncbi:MAG TPA: fimbrial protein [Thiopseudomonas sp.]|nr:fimbrial protein [Thiopseudomonas sp.]
MRKVPFALILACGLASGSAFAATQGTVTINGEVVAETCAIVAGDVDKTVTLATVPESAFTAADQIVAPQTFTIGLENCNAGVDVYAAFSAPIADVDSTTYTLINKGTAGNVNVVLTEQDDTKILLNDETYTLTTAQTVTTVADANTLTYRAAYYSTDAAVTAGTVTATANYVIAYQ